MRNLHKILHLPFVFWQFTWLVSLLDINAWLLVGGGSRFATGGAWL
jgi:hypothetical protein